MKIRPISKRKADLYGALLAAGIFVIDYLHPLGAATGMPYVALPLLGLLARSPAVVVSLAVLGSVLTGLGYFASEPAASLYVIAINRGMTVALIWIVALTAVRHLAVGDSLRRSLEKQASHDPLTDLFNRRHVFRRIETELRRYRRYGERFSLILIDADHFKRVNDAFGHCAGDAVLKRIADICRNSVRETDVAGRFGGEEFIVLLPHTNASEAAVVAERIRSTMHESRFDWQDDSIAVTLSLGVAMAGPGADSFDVILKAADEALYDAKRCGRDCVRVARQRNYQPGRDERHAA